MLNTSRDKATLALAAALAVSALAPMTAHAAESGDYKRATDRDMQIPDESGYLIVTRDAKKVTSCTSDDHYVITYIFATATPVSATYIAPAQADAYLTTLKSAYIKASQTQSVSLFNLGQNYPMTLPPPVFKGLEDASNQFNKTNGTSLNWMVRAFTTSNTAYQPCIDRRQRAQSRQP